MPDPNVHLVLSVGLRNFTIYAEGGRSVRTIRPSKVGAGTGGAHVDLTPEQLRILIDALAATAGYYPTDPSLDAQRETIRAAADELRLLRAGADVDTAALVDLALHRHIGENLADAADLVLACRNHMHERVVAEMAAELVGLLDAQGPIPITNQDERIYGHHRRINELRAQLPQPGRTSE